MAGFKVEWFEGSAVTLHDINVFIERARNNTFTEWGGFSLLGAHCFAPPGVQPAYVWRDIDPLPMPVRLFAETPPDPTSNCRLRQQGAEYTLANTRA
eukprot:5660981-Prorocentrum_lima.AAC.1